MSILKIIAILGVVLGILSCIMETRKTGKRYLGIFVALIVASAALFVIAGQAEDRFTAIAAEKTLQPQGEPQALAAVDAIQPADNQPVDDVAGAETVENDGDEYNMMDDSDEAAPAGAQALEQPDSADDAQAPNTEIAAVEGEQAEPPTQNPKAAPNAAIADSNEPPKSAPLAARERKHPDAARIKAAPADDTENVADAAPDNVEDNNESAVADFAGSKIIADAGPDIDSAKLNDPIQFSAKQTKIPKGASIRSFSWDFGDGHKADGRDVKHAYTDMGIFTAVLTVTDTSGQNYIDTKKIDVNRPENKIKLAFKALEDLQQVTQAPAAFVSMFEKTYAGTKINIDATGYILAEAGGKCELVVSIDGPNCVVSKNKILENGGEGDVNVKASCKGDPGEYTWMVTRKVHKGICTFNSIKVDVSEN